jgi:S1 RNA binding domain
MTTTRQRRAMRDDADAALRRFPLGGQVIGTVVAIPVRARVGAFVDLGDGAQGFIGVEHLPDDPGQWPRVGTQTRFEVLRHDFPRRRRSCQVRLWPLESRFRRAGPVAGAFTVPEWRLARDHYPVGTVVTATVSGVSPDSCCYGIRFGAGQGSVTSAVELPPAGTTHRYVVVAVLETTQRLVLALADEPGDG